MIGFLRDFSHAWRALGHRNFRLFLGGQSVSLIGTWMTRVATSWLVYRLTGSALLLRLVGFAGQIPTFLFAPLAGVWVDRLNRQYVLVVTQFLAMLQSFALAVLTLMKIITIHEILALRHFKDFRMLLRKRRATKTLRSERLAKKAPANRWSLSLVSVRRLSLLLV